MIIEAETLEQMKICANQNPHVAYAIGEYYYTQGDYEEAVEWYKIASTGTPPDPLALFALGYAYQTGQGTSVDLIQALHYYEAAASKDVPQAFYNLAYFHQNGLVVERNQALADHYVMRAAECLKVLTEELFDAKNAQRQILNRYDDTVRNIVQNSEEWMQIGKDREMLKEQHALLQSQIETLREKNQNINTELVQMKENLQQKDAAHELLLQTHLQVLMLVDEQRTELSKISKEKEAANAYGNEQKSQCDVLTECISQKDQEIEDVFQLYVDSQDKLLEIQKESARFQADLQAEVKTNEQLEVGIAELNETIGKLKQSRIWFFLLGVLGVLVPIIVAQFI